MDTSIINQKLSNIHICIHNDSSIQIYDSFIKHSIENLNDYYISYLQTNNISYSVITNFAEGISETLFANKQYMLFVQKGNLLQFNNILIDAILKQLHSKDYKFIGHILDFFNGSFYIHPQFFIIDVVWANEHNVNNIGQYSQQYWVGHQLERSKENILKNIKNWPLWVKATNKIQQFKGRGQGWDIIEKLCETNAEFSVWSKEVIDNKKFVYPDEQNSDKTLFYRSNIIKYGTDIRTFITNTEDIDNNVIKQFRHVKNIMIPACGPNTFLYPYLLESIENIIVYDINPFSLYIFEKIWSSWNGNDYEQYVSENWNIYDENLFDQESASLLFQENDRFKRYDNDWSTWWQNRQKQNVKFIYTDLFNIDTWGKLIYNFPANETLIIIENILNYGPTSIWYNTKEKYRILNSFNQFVKTKLGNHNVNFYGRDIKNNSFFLGPINDKN